MTVRERRPFSAAMSAGDLVSAAAERSPESPAIVDAATGRSITYAALVAEVRAVAGGLAGAGVRRGDLVAIAAPNSLEHAVTILAVEWMGAVPALMNPRLEPSVVAELIRRGAIRHALVGARPQLLDAVRDALPADGVLLTLDGRVEGMDEVTTCRADSAFGASVTREPHEPGFVFYTSGTTGLPKGVVIPRAATLPRVVFMATQGGLSHGAGNRAAGVLPLYHVMGFYAVFLSALALDGVYYAISRWDADELLQVIARERITSLIASPTHLHDLLDARDRSEHGLGTLRTIAHTGAPMSTALLERLVSAVRAPIWQLYGTTETMNSLYAGHQTGDPQRLRPGLFAQVRVIRPGAGPGARVEPGAEGELVVSMDSPVVFSGYLGQPELTAEKTAGGWYRTGDAARETSTGEIELLGRCDDMIISGAENIHPEEVEAVLAAHPGVRAVAVIGVASPRWGEIPVACVELDRPAPTPVELDAHCRTSSLANYKRPRHYIAVEELPRNALSKTLRAPVRELAARELAHLEQLQFEPAQPR